MSKKNDYLRCSDNETDVFSTPFINEKDRLKKISNSYKNVDVARAFAMYYNMELRESLKKIKQVECIPSLEIGKVYSAFVKEIGKNGIEFTFDGAKEFTIVCKESFATCLDEVNNYLLNHDNKLMFEVREKKNDVYYVSVINAYYKSWVSMINNYIDKEEFINVHINELVNGGYVGTTILTELFCVGFLKGESNVSANQQISKIDIPKNVSDGADESLAFMGYFYKPNGIDVEYQIVDSEGNIIASSRMFKQNELDGNVYAKWGICSNGYTIINGVCTQQTYTVTLNKGSNTYSGDDSYTVKYGNKVKDIEIPFKKGYYFQGYNDDSGNMYHNNE